MSEPASPEQSAKLLQWPPFSFLLLSGAVVLFVIGFLLTHGGISLFWGLIGGGWAVGAIGLPIAVTRTTNRYLLIAAAFWWVPLLGLLIVNGLQHIG